MAEKFQAFTQKSSELAAQPFTKNTEKSILLEKSSEIRLTDRPHQDTRTCNNRVQFCHDPRNQRDDREWRLINGNHDRDRAFGQRHRHRRRLHTVVLVI